MSKREQSGEPGIHSGTIVRRCFRGHLNPPSSITVPSNTTTKYLSLVVGGGLVLQKVKDHAGA
jgi:hypothetical protein